MHQLGLWLKRSSPLSGQWWLLMGKARNGRGESNIGVQMICDWCVCVCVHVCLWDTSSESHVSGMMRS